MSSLDQRLGAKVLQAGTEAMIHAVNSGSHVSPLPGTSNRSLGDVLQMSDEILGKGEGREARVIIYFKNIFFF